MPLFLILMAAFIAVPLIEIALFIQVGGLIGLWPTLGLIILTALLGAILARLEGLATLREVRASLDRGELPLAEVVSGAVLLLAAALLVTPGFFTDSLGFLLLLRPVRLWLGKRLLSALLAGRAPPGGGRRGPGVIEVEAYRVDEDPR